MKVTTSGKPSQIDSKTCKDAIRFFGKKLLTPSLFEKVEVHIEFENFGKGTNEFAYCEWVDTNHRAKQFIITANKKLSRKDMILALAHEMVHVKQYARGELKDYLKSRKCKWKDEVLDLEQVDYWDLPWEIEAFGREKGLYVRYMEHLRSKDDAV